MLNKDKVDEVEVNLDAVKNERNLYIPRAVIKRLKSTRLMPFGGRSIISDDNRNDGAAGILFYVVLNQQQAYDDSNEFK